MINDRQFILSRNEYKWTNWMSIRMASGYYLNYENHLNVIVNNTKSVALIGYAWQVDSSRLSPKKLIKTSWGGEEYSRSNSD